jgi:hypothetical protein
MLDFWYLFFVQFTSLPYPLSINGQSFQLKTQMHPKSGEGLKFSCRSSIVCQNELLGMELNFSRSQDMN